MEVGLPGYTPTRSLPLGARTFCICASGARVLPAQAASNSAALGYERMDDKLAAD